MKKLPFALIFLATAQLFAQRNQPEDFGFRHLQTFYKGDTVDILVRSKKGDEQKIKPLFFFCQGSRPVPLIIKDGERTYNTFPFDADSLAEHYHLIIVSKPFIPLVVEAKTLGQGLVYEDPKTHATPKNYSNRNLPDYYVRRNLLVINFMQKQPFADKNKLVVAGHSEGSGVAAKLALTSNKVTHLIYASGCPLGRIVDIITKDRANETDTDTARYAEEEFKYWQSVVDNKEDMDDSQGDTYKATYDFSIPPIQYLQQLKIPVLICYGTKDWSAPYNDYLRVEMIRQKKKNFTYTSYIGLEHNFFPLTKTGQPDYDIFNWNKVALDWKKWMSKN